MDSHWFLSHRRQQINPPTLECLLEKHLSQLSNKRCVSLMTSSSIVLLNNQGRLTLNYSVIFTHRMPKLCTCSRNLWWILFVILYWFNVLTDLVFLMYSLCLLSFFPDFSTWQSQLRGARGLYPPPSLFNWLAQGTQWSHWWFSSSPSALTASSLCFLFQVASQLGRLGVYMPRVFSNPPAGGVQPASQAAGTGNPRHTDAPPTVGTSSPGVQQTQGLHQTSTSMPKDVVAVGLGGPVQATVQTPAPPELQPTQGNAPWGCSRRRASIRQLREMMKVSD